MTYYVYIIYSASRDKYYKGYTTNLENRLRQHNSGQTNSTKNGIPWIYKYFLEKETKKEALILERKLKNLNRSRLEDFIVKYKKIM